MYKDGPSANPRFVTDTVKKGQNRTFRWTVFTWLL